MCFCHLAVAFIIWQWLLSFGSDVHHLAVAFVIWQWLLLFETGFDDMVDTTLVIDVDEQTQRSRAMARSGMQIEQLNALLKRQYSRSQRLARADAVIDGSLPLSQFRQQIRSIDEGYRRRAG